MGTVGFSPNDPQGLRQHEALLRKEMKIYLLSAFEFCLIVLEAK